MLTIYWLLLIFIWNKGMVCWFEMVKNRGKAKKIFWQVLVEKFEIINIKFIVQIWLLSLFFDFDKF